MSALVVRLATESDCLDILRWRNDPMSRAMSRNTGVIDERQHCAWFSKALEDPQRLLLVGVRDAHKLGMVRFDLFTPEQWEVSIVVAPEVRGTGQGKSLLTLALSHFFSAWPENAVLAEIREKNLYSERLFRSVGFVASCSQGEINQYIVDKHGFERNTHLFHASR